MRTDVTEAADVDAQLGQLASNAGFQQNVGTQLDGLAAENAPAPAADPVNAAFDAINKAAAKTFADSLATGNADQGVFQRIEQSPDVQAVNMARATAADKYAPYGGKELVTAFQQEQPGQEGTIGNGDAQQFGQRMKSVALMNQIDPNSVKALVDYRNGLNPADRQTFDDAHFGLFDNDIATTVAVLGNKGNPIMSANPIADLSPQQVKLENGYRSKVGLPPLSAQNNSPDDNGIENMIRNAPDMFNEYLTQKAQMTGNPQDANTLQAFQRLTGVDNSLFNGTLKAQAIDKISGAIAKSITDLSPYTAPVVGLSGELGGPGASDVRPVEQAVTKTLLNKATVNPADNPREVASNAAIAASLFVPIVGESEGIDLVGRIAINGLIGGEAAAAPEVLANKNPNLEKVGRDFAIGAFLNASLPEVSWAFSRVGNEGSTDAIKAVLEDSGGKSDLISTVGADGNVIHLSAPPSPPAVEGLMPGLGHNMPGNDPTELLTIHPNLAHETTDAVSDMVVARLEAEKATSQAAALEQQWRAETSTREAAAALEPGAQTGFAREVANRSKNLTTAEQLGTARQAAADAQSALNDAIERTNNAAVRAAMQTAHDTIDNAIAATQTYYHGTAASELEGGALRAGTFVTPNASEAQLYAERDASVRQALGDTGATPRVLEVQVKPEQLQEVPADAQLSASQGSKVLSEAVAPSNLPAIGGGADLTGVRKSLQDSFDAMILQAKRLIDPNNGLLASAIARIEGTISGTLPGRVGVLAQGRENLLMQLNQWTDSALSDLAKNINNVMRQERNGIRFIGPADKADMAKAYTPLMLIQHPEWFSGSSVSRLYAQAQAVHDQVIGLLKEWGYPIKELDGIYLSQLWDTNIKSTAPGVLRGIAGTAKNREFVDYEAGIKAGLTPKTTNIGDLVMAHQRALNEAMADAVFKKAIIQEGVLTKGTASALSGKFSTNSGLFSGLVGDQKTVEAIDTLLAPVSGSLNTARGVSQRIKTTLLGLGGPVAVGTHFLEALTTGDGALALGQIERLTRALGVSHVPWNDMNQLGDKAMVAGWGVKMGERSVDLAPREGTVLGLVPGRWMRKPDQLATRVSDAMGHAVFGTLSDPFRVEMAKGAMYLMHLAGQDVQDPAVQKAVADFVNRSFLTSRGAQSPVRNAIENVGLLSAKTTRGEFATLLSPLTIPSALKGDPRGILAALTLTSMAGSVYGIQYGAHLAFGSAKPDWNPRDLNTWKNLGSINVDGRNIRFLKERGVIESMVKSYQALQGQDPKTLSDIWQRFYVGKSGPLPQAALNLLGYGYDKNGFYQGGGLPTKDRLMNLIPFPIVTQQVGRNGISAFDPTSMALESFGLSNYLDSTKTQRDNFLRDPAHNPYNPSDPRYQDVLAHGYAGLEKAERIEFKQNHPEFFNGTPQYPSAEAKAIADKTAQLQKGLWDLNNQIQVDPSKRVDYKNARKDILLQLATLSQLSQTKQGPPVTLQDTATDLYYKVIDAADKAANGNLTGDAFGKAEQDARNQVLAKYAQAGLDALDRGLVAGQTPVDTEYRKASKQIADSGYYNLPDTAIKAQGLPFKDYADWLSELNAYAKEHNVDPTQLPAFTKMQSDISKAKIAFRVDHPDIDAELAIWDGATPQTTQAAQIASRVLGEQVKQKKGKGANGPSIEQIISSLSR